MNQPHTIHAVTVISSILLALIIRGGIETFVKSLIRDRTLKEMWEAGRPGPEGTVRILQFLMFLLLLARFYFGVYRSNEEQTQNPTVVDSCITLFGTFGLFLFFYAISVNVWKLDLFYVTVFWMHVFDLLWFLIVAVELPPAKVLHAAIFFIVIDVVTLVLFGFFSWWKWNDFWNVAGSVKLQQWLLALLFVMSLLDFWILRRFYFDPGTWKTDPKLLFWFQGTASSIILEGH